MITFTASTKGEKLSDVFTIAAPIWAKRKHIVEAAAIFTELAAKWRGHVNKPTNKKARKS